MGQGPISYVVQYMVGGFLLGVRLVGYESYVKGMSGIVKSYVTQSPTPFDSFLDTI